MFKWLARWQMRRRCKKFRSRNYPVLIKTFPSVNMVLVRNLGTHQHGGWLIYVDTAIARWGKETISRLDVIDG